MDKTLIRKLGRSGLGALSEVALQEREETALAPDGRTGCRAFDAQRRRSASAAPGSVPALVVVGAAAASTRQGYPYPLTVLENLCTLMGPIRALPSRAAESARSGRRPARPLQLLPAPELRRARGLNPSSSEKGFMLTLELQNGSSSAFELDHRQSHCRRAGDRPVVSMPRALSLDGARAHTAPASPLRPYPYRRCERSDRYLRGRARGAA